MQGRDEVVYRLEREVAEGSNAKAILRQEN